MKDMLKHFEIVDCHMSIMIHDLSSHINGLPTNLGEFSEEQCELLKIFILGNTIVKICFIK